MRILDLSSAYNVTKGKPHTEASFFSNSIKQIWKLVCSKKSFHNILARYYLIGFQKKTECHSKTNEQQSWIFIVFNH